MKYEIVKSLTGIYYANRKGFVRARGSYQDIVDYLTNQKEKHKIEATIAGFTDKKEVEGIEKLAN